MPVTRKERSSKRRPGMSKLKIEIYISGSSVIVALVLGSAMLGHVQGV
jgi:hypothetical protein